MSSGERGAVVGGGIVDPRHVAEKVRAAFDGAQFIHLVARGRSDTSALPGGGVREFRVESWMGTDRVKSIARDGAGRLVGAVMLVDGRATELNADEQRLEYASEPNAAGIAFPKLLDDQAQHALGDYLETWVGPQTENDAPAWFVDAIARGAFRGRETVNGRECLVFDDMHALPHRQVTHTIRIDAATMLPMSIKTTGKGVSVVCSLERVYERIGLFASDAGWEWKLDDVSAAR